MVILGVGGRSRDDNRRATDTDQIITLRAVLNRARRNTGRADDLCFQAKVISSAHSRASTAVGGFTSRCVISVNMKSKALVIAPCAVIKLPFDLFEVE